jgi:hypothetical protein
MEANWAPLSAATESRVHSTSAGNRTLDVRFVAMGLGLAMLKLTLDISVTALAPSGLAKR